MGLKVRKVEPPERNAVQARWGKTILLQSKIAWTRKLLNEMQVFFELIMTFDPQTSATSGIYMLTFFLWCPTCRFHFKNLICYFCVDSKRWWLLHSQLVSLMKQDEHRTLISKYINIIALETPKWMSQIIILIFSPRQHEWMHAYTSIVYQ